MTRVRLKFSTNRANFKKRIKDISDMVEGEIEASAFDIRSQAVTTVPVDTGILKGSIKVVPGEHRFHKIIEAGAHYAPYIEFGTGTLVNVPSGLEDYAIQFKGKGVKQVNLPARPFLIPAWEQERLKLVERIKKQL